MLMISYDKNLLLTNCGLLCAYLKIRVLSCISGLCKPQSYKKMGLHIFLYVPSDLVSNYGNCNFPVCFIKSKAFLWTTMELTKLEDNVHVPVPLIWFLQLPNSENKNQLCSKQELCKIYQWQSSLTSFQDSLSYVTFLFNLEWCII